MNTSESNLVPAVSQDLSLAQDFHNSGLLFPENCLGLNEVDSDGRTKLHHAVRRGSEEEVRALLGRGASVDIRDRLTYEPLHYAVANGSAGLINLLLNSGANPTSKVHMDQNTLHLAVLHKVRLQSLLRTRHGIDLQDRRGRTPLNLLLSTTDLDESSEEDIQLLLNAGADVNLPNKAGDTSFHLLLNREYSNTSPLIYSTIQLFLRNGANLSDPSPNGRTPLQIFLEKSQGAWVAAKSCHTLFEQAHACLFSFIHQGAATDVRTPTGELLAHEYLQTLARKATNSEHMAKLLVSKAAISQTGLKGNYVIHEVLRLVDARERTGTTVGQLKALLDRKVDLNVQNVRGQSPIMILMSMKEIYSSDPVREAKQLLRILLGRGASVWIRDSSGKLPIYQAMLNFCENDRYEMARILLLTAAGEVSSCEPDHTAASWQDSSWWEAWSAASTCEDWTKYESMLSAAKSSLPDDVRNILYPIMMRLLAESYIEKSKQRSSANQISTIEHRDYVAVVMKGMVKIGVPIPRNLIVHLLGLI